LQTKTWNFSEIEIINLFLNIKMILIISIFFMFSAALANPILPEKLIVGYPSWEECDAKVIKAAQQGVNVIIWFAINLITNEKTGIPEISGGPDYKCVAQTASYLKENNLPTIHLISIGGWNSPHPDTRNNASAYYEAWLNWNHQNANFSVGFKGFDGFDWDLEGNDDLNSKYNYFTIECLDLIGEMSQLAKKNGLIVSMAPAESYLDATTSRFDRSLKHIYPEWETLIPKFTYHGHNVYAYLIAKYGLTLIHKNQNVFTYDFVSVQFYEGYSHIEYNTTILKQNASDYLMKIIPKYLSGWQVTFEEDSDSGLKNQIIKIPKENLVIGLANGWAGDGKFILIDIDELEEAYSKLKCMDMDIRGFMFWNIVDEGKVPLNNDKEYWLASGLNSFLCTRKMKK